MSDTPYGRAWDAWLDKHLDPRIRLGYAYELAQNAFSAAWGAGIRFANGQLTEDFRPAVVDRVYVKDGVAIMCGQPAVYPWLAEDDPLQHNCDAMGCSSIGPHVVTRRRVSNEND